MELGAHKQQILGFLVGGIVVFVAAAVTGSTVMYGVADISIGVALIPTLIAPTTLNFPYRALLRIGLLIAAVSAIVDGVLSLIGETGAVTSALTFGILGGILIAAVGSTFGKHQD